MIRIIKNIVNFIKSVGINPALILISLKGLPSYFKNFIVFFKQNRTSQSQLPIQSLRPCLSDRYMQSGDIDKHYFYQDLFVANKIFVANPVKHVDIGSRLDGFVAHIASFREIEILDIRPLDSNIKNVKFRKADLMNSALITSEYCDSISSLHAIEHFGLGRYGDPINADGFITAIENIFAMLKPEGVFYFSVPFGPQRIEFDAHRVFSLDYLIPFLSKLFRVKCFSYIDDNGILWENKKLNQEYLKDNFNCYYGCAIFELIKPSSDE